MITMDCHLLENISLKSFNLFRLFSRAVLARHIVDERKICRCDTLSSFKEMIRVVKGQSRRLSLYGAQYIPVYSAHFPFQADDGSEAVLSFSRRLRRRRLTGTIQYADESLLLHIRHCGIGRVQ